LIEIMLATFILAVVMIPILQLIFGGMKDTARGRDRSTAVSLAANVMTQLIEKVPFSAFQFDHADAPLALDLDGFFHSTAEVAGLFATRKQVVLEAMDSDWERILDQDSSPGDGTRTIVKDGTSFEVILYGGLYKEDASTTEANGNYNKPLLKKELTFSFFRNPFVTMDASQRAAVRQLVVLGGSDPKPYDAAGEDVTGVTRVDDPRIRPGWPSLTSGSGIDAGNFYRGDSTPISDTDDPNANPLKTWARHTLDLSDFREEGGAFIKLVLGIRWRPGIRPGKTEGYAPTTKEFWLVSFKAKLEES
jgi:hypothetical protein